jgi:adenine C2-methylase RlmN of 23S rRNA A2503 and tRNA A37
MGLMANLSSGEIIEQLIHANQVEKIRGIVFMGMGEPLDNYREVLKAIKAMTDPAQFGLAASRITISTVGIVPKILSMVQDAPQVGLALSLHAPNQDLRLKIVPTAKAWPIEKIMSATETFILNQNQNRKRRRHVLIEYVLIANINDSEEVAHQLGQLLQGKDVLLNVIPYNPTTVNYDFKRPSRVTQDAFVSICRDYGVHTLLRQTMGQDIDGACGQLVINTAKASGCNKVTDVEDLMSTSTPKERPQTKTRSTPSHHLYYGFIVLLICILWVYCKHL